MSKRWGIIGALILGLGVGGGVAVWAQLASATSGNGAAPAADEQNMARSERAELELAKLRSEVRALDRAQRQMGNAAAQPDDTKKKEVEEDQADFETPPEPQEGGMANGEQQIAALETQILSEPRDPDWSVLAEAELMDSLRGLSSQGLSLAEATCSSTLCRVTMTIDDPTMGVDSYRPVFGAVDWQSQRFAHVDGDVTHHVRAYFMRDGHPLPRP